MSLKVKITGKKLKSFIEGVSELKEEAIDKKTATRIGIGVTSKMLDFISKGISPIQGAGRFPAYKNPKKYPGDLKAKRPVNLYLSGDFLKSLDYREIKTSSGYATEIFYIGEESKKEQGHREGAHGQPKRPTIPQGREEFVVAIQRIITNLFKDRIAEVIKKFSK
jgi:hypothetical protein